MSSAETGILELAVSVKGEITKSNFDDFKAIAEQRISEINFSPVTDEEFGKAEDDAKDLAKFEKDLAASEEGVLKQMDEVYHLVSGIGELKKLSASSRLKLKKQIDSQKKVVRAQIKRAAIADIPISHPHAESRIEGAMKGKRTLDSLRSAAQSESELIQKEIEAAQEVVDRFRKNEGDDVCYDEHRLLILSCDLVDAELCRRVERRSAALKEAELKAEAEKARKEAEEQKRQAELEKQKSEPEESPQTPPEAERPLPTRPTPRDVTNYDAVAEEFARYLDTVRQSCAPFKAAREALEHPENVAKARKFSETLNAAFVELKGGSNE